MPYLNPARESVKPRRGLFPILVLMPLALAAVLGGCSSDDDPTAVEQPAYVYQEQTYEVESWDYLNNRFFFLDLPPYGPAAPVSDIPGRAEGLQIDPASIQVYSYVHPVPIQKDYVTNLAAVIDTTGTWGYHDDHAAWFAAIAEDDWVLQDTWAPADFDLVLDADGCVVAIDMTEELYASDILAVVYDVVDANDEFQYRVGNRPDAPTDVLEIGGMNFCAMKLLKAQYHTPHIFHYVLRNIYDLGESNIDVANFSFSIENATSDDQPELDFATAGGLPFIRIFGLDQMTTTGAMEHDGIPDYHNPYLFDLRRGLLKFPLDCPMPFNATESQYTAYADDAAFVFNDSYVAQYLTPQIYDPVVSPDHYPDFAPFRLKMTIGRWVPTAAGSALGDVSLDRLDWTWASAPIDREPEDRVETVRWFQPRDLVLRRYFNPTLDGATGDATIDVLELFLREDSGSWSTDNWGGVMTSLPARADVSLPPANLTDSHYFEIWVNDGRPNLDQRHGKLHIDFGTISEDFFWPENNVFELVTGTFQQEDGIVPGTEPDGVWTALTEDIGLAGIEADPYLFNADYEYRSDPPYAGINGTARNNREDSEDVDGNGTFTRDNGYFTLTIDLAEDDPVIDVVYDFADEAPDAVTGLVTDGIAWRLYQFRLNEALPVSDYTTPDLSEVTHMRIWYEDDAPGVIYKTTLQIARMRFTAAEAKAEL